MKKKGVFCFAAIGMLLFMTVGAYGQVVINRVLYGQGQDCSLSGVNTLGLGYRLDPSVDDAFELMNDIGGTSVVASVAQFDRTSDGWNAYTGTSGVPFFLVPAEGYLVQLRAGVAQVNYVFVANHDPSWVVGFDGLGTAGSRSGTNFYAPPYHATAATAEDLINELGGTSVVAWVGGFDICTNSWSTYSGTQGPSFPLELANAYLVRLQPTVPYLFFVPWHY
jgi:hypothetical protein